MKSSKLAKYKFFRWITAVFLGWKWSKNYSTPVDQQRVEANKKMIPKIWAP